MKLIFCIFRNTTHSQLEQYQNKSKKNYLLKWKGDYFYLIYF